MTRRGKVFIFNKFAGVLEESSDGGYRFQYTPSYRAKPNAKAASLTLPLRTEPFHSKTMFPFFDGLIPEGWLLNIALKNWKIDPHDRMELLLKVCGDCIGAVHVEPFPDKQDL